MDDPSCTPDVIVRPFRDSREMEICVSLQRRVWEYDDIDVVPGPIFVVAAKTGGQVIGAFRANHAVGFALSFPAIRETRVHLFSHMVAVLPEFQDIGVGRRLKLAQRDHAIARGIDLIEWTFDPLQIKNAHFNIAKLGAIVRKYLPNLYGLTSSPLHAGLPTDRVVAEWWVRSQHVKDVLEGRSRMDREPSERISVPSSIREVCLRDPEQATSMQSRLRQDFERCFAKGLAATGFELAQDHASYVMDAGSIEEPGKM
ncbi:MAG TPA: GNAT family N-acetyltransferase [Candidatus Dormibacteraeota bacterium]|nr:GNAT family N-acetyltransferase [Candidatus Dormibacteraeota bacterium]